MRILNIILISLSICLKASASQCDINLGQENIIYHQLTTDIDNLTNFALCDSFNSTDTYKEVKSKLGIIVAHQTNQVMTIKDRHEMGIALNTCEPQKDSKAFVISFAGTGAYNPRTHSLLAKLVKCEKFQNLPLSLRKRAYGFFYNELKEKNSVFTKWSGIDKGIMSSLLSDSKINNYARHFDFATFPSEESELIADPEKVDLDALSQIAEEVSSSIQSLPKGISNAKECLLRYAMKSKELKIHPKLIILSHSSGGRSAVKFLELMKDNKIEADLVMSIDPVIEAQHAIVEVTDQYAGRALDSLNPFSNEDKKPVNVWSRKHPKKLYKTNAKKWVNFYQTDDKNGFGMKPKFGIQGSPVLGANNFFIKNTGASGHGKICYKKDVLETMNKSILELLSE